MHKEGMHEDSAAVATDPAGSKSRVDLDVASRFIAAQLRGKCVARG